ncbi:hypothetical protein ACFZB5_13350 [Streptomyces nodosus]|uniref:hypothetical protein n=1 Tax=Streptomyces nodosus TaxID=40318 RepID=UPI0036E67414
MKEGTMAHRPYPNRERALNQLGRHYPEPPLVECLRPMGEAFTKLRAAAAGWRPDFVMDGETGQIAPFVGDYQLSTRHPGVVGGPR